MAPEETIDGNWWLPDRANMPILGKIKYGPMIGAELILQGVLFEKPTLDRFTLWGITAKGKKVTLFNCLQHKMTLHLPGFPGSHNSEVSSVFGVVGGHFRQIEDIKFVKVSVDFTYLRHWVGVTGILGTIASNKIQITQQAPPDIDLGSIGNFGLSFEFAENCSPDWGNFRLTENCVLTLKTSDPTEYTLFEKIVMDFQYFLTLGVSSPIYSLSVIGRLDKPREVIDGQGICDNYEIIRRNSQANHEQPPITAHDMQFSLADIQPKAGHYFARFVEKRNRLSPVCDFYFSTMYNKQMYLHQRFLAVAHAVEAYHRAFIGGKYQADSKYEQGVEKILWQAIPGDIEPDFRASLKNKLKYLHEYSLRKRIQDICGMFGNLLTPFFGDASDFAGEVAELRNSLTHPTPTAEEAPVLKKHQVLFVKAEQLSLLLELCFLREMEFSDEAISKIASRSKRIAAIRLNRHRQPSEV